jgi:hypothetical protein
MFRNQPSRSNSHYAGAMAVLIYPVVLMAATYSTQVARADEQEIRKCDFDVKARCASGDASVTIANGIVKRVEVNIHWCGLKGQPGYTCSIDSSRSDPDAKWSEDAGATLITNASPFSPDQPDKVRVTVGRHVSIDLDQTQSLGRCGAGAELPRAIVIPEKRAACRVWLRAP